MAKGNRHTNVAIAEKACDLESEIRARRASQHPKRLRKRGIKVAPGDLEALKQYF